MNFSLRSRAGSVGRTGFCD